VSISLTSAQALRGMHTPDSVISAAITASGKPAVEVKISFDAVSQSGDEAVTEALRLLERIYVGVCQILAGQKGRQVELDSGPSNENFR
jgi:hypothetical protein